jgi:outer membrane murein-binding lipoprotein Lpp
MTAKEKYETLEAKKDKYTAETQSLYARIDELRKKVGLLEPEIQAAFKQYMQERKK